MTEKQRGLCISCAFYLEWDEPRPYGSTVAYEPMSECHGFDNETKSDGTPWTPEDTATFEKDGCGVDFECPAWRMDELFDKEEG